MKYTKHIFALTLFYMMSAAVAFGINGYKDSIYVDFCEGDSYTLEMSGQVVTTKGLYFDTLVTPEDEDSIRCYFVNVHPIVHSTENKELLIGSSLEWQGYTIDRAGEYSKTLRSIYGCDSIATLVVTYTYPHPTHYSKETASICEGESYEWQGTVYTETGIYYKKYEAIDHQDSVCVLELTVNPKYLFNETLSFCSFPQIYKGLTIDAPGTYTATYQSITGCDSVYHIVINQADEYHFEETQTINEGESIIWHNQTISAEGDYYDNLHSIYGCDSTYILHVFIQPNPSKTTLIEEHIKICENETYTWRGHEYSTANIYQDIVKQTVDPTKDSIIYRLYLEVIQPIRVERYANICLNDTLWINEQPITKPGIFRDTLRAESTGCDSIVTWVVNVNQTYLTKSIIQWDSDQVPYQWLGDDYFTTGIYEKQLKTVNGCDSIFRLELTIRPVYRFDTTVYVCANEMPYQWRGATYSVAGTYTPYQGKTVLGADSSYTIHLHVSEPSITPINATICANEHYLFKGQKLTTPGVYYDTLVNAAGCDSVLMLTLNVFTSDTVTEHVNLAKGESYEWQGATYSEAGVYTQLYKNIHGCDSVRQLILNVHNTYLFDTTATVCASQLPFQWHGIEGTQTDTYRKNYVTQQGYDSTYVLHLTVLPIPVYRFNETICKSQTYTFGGRLLNETGVYTHTFKTDGCDSIVELSLSVLDVDTTYEIHQVDEGQTYWLNGKEYASPGIYDSTFTNRFGCDSIRRLLLTVHQVDTIDTTAVICASERPLIWHNIEGRQTNTYTSVEETPSGDKIVYVMHLTVNEAVHTHVTEYACAGTTYQFGKRYLTETGTYYDTLKTYLGCDSIVELALNVYGTDTIEETRHIPVGGSLEWRGNTYSDPGMYYQQDVNEHGCIRVYKLILRVHPTYLIETSATICASNTPYEWHGLHAYSTGDYHKSYTTVDGYDSTYVLHLEVFPEIPVTHITASICHGSNYIFGEENLTETGTYRHTYYSQNGCDSVVELTLNVFDIDTLYEEKHILQGETLTWHEQDYTEPGVYFSKETNEHGCDLVYVLTLRVFSNFSHKDSVTICSNEVPYEWQGNSYLSTGIYYDSYKTVHGYDSTYILDLTVLPPVEMPVYLSICDNQSVTYHGITYNEKGTYFDRRGCDTTYKIVVTQLPVEIYTTRAVFNGIDPYTWSFNGQTYTSAGIYDEVFKSVVTGCDSIYRLDLRQDANFLSEETVSICEGDFYEWRGQKLSHTGIGTTTIYYDSLKTISGLDSVYKLTLEVRPVVEVNHTISFCNQITFKGQVYNSSAIVRDTLTSLQYGCDSIVIYHLNREYAYFFHDTVTIVNGESITWQGRTIVSEGLYHVDYKTTTGCDSIYELAVGVLPAPEQKYVISTRAIMCENDSIEWRNKWIYSAGTYYDSLRTVDGTTDSVYVIHVETRPVYHFTQHLYACGEGSVTYNGKQYTESGIYVDTLKTLQGCDSIATLHVHINTSYFHSDTLRTHNRDTVIWHGQKIYLSGTYTDRHPSPTGCDSVWQLVAEIYPTYLFEQDTTVCQCETPFNWRGRMIGELGFHTYDTAYKTINGYDSIYRINVTVYPNYFMHEPITICEGQRYTLNGKTYVNMGADSVAYDTVRFSTQHHCDSTIVYVIHETASKYSLENKVLHSTDSMIVWDGDTIRNAGLVHHEYKTTSGCDSILDLMVVKEIADTVLDRCAITDLPYLWTPYPGKTIEVNDYAEYLTDTLFENGYIMAFHSLHLEVKHPVDTTVYLRGCMDDMGVTFNDKTYMRDTIVNDTLDCDTIYRVHVKIDTVYNVMLLDTICEHELPYVLGRQKPDTIWQEGKYRHRDTTACGCDSIVQLRLFIIPDLHKNDSIIICEQEIKAHPVVLGNLYDPARPIDQLYPDYAEYKHLGDTTHQPAFCNLYPNWREWSGPYGPWKGIEYNEDTIVWNCDSTYSFHVIVKPQQIKDSIYYLCAGDSIQFGFWPDGTQRWIKEGGLYTDSFPSDRMWMDEKHGIEYNSDTLLCDEIIRLKVELLQPAPKDSTAHIAMGDSIWWGHQYEHYSGDYDSIISVQYINKLDARFDTTYCTTTYTLHLFVDSTYHYRDTIDVCADTIKTLSHVWADGHIQSFNTPNIDTIIHFIENIRTEEYHFDSIYDLRVNFHAVRTSYISADICQGDSIQFGIQSDGEPRWVKAKGIYRDTLMNPINGCDSIVELRLNWWQNYYSETQKDITDKELPYIWYHIQGEDTIHIDTLYTACDTSYTFQDKRHGCDSITHLTLRIHKTYHFIDSITLCQNETPYTWVDAAGNIVKEDIYESGTYFQYLLTKDGYDSIYERHITVYPIIDTVITHTMCRGSFIRFKGQNIYDEGTYKDTLVSSNGCDSIVTLHLRVSDPYYKTEVVHIIEGGSTVFFGETYSVAGEYYHHAITPDGCDSTTILQLIVHPKVDTVVTVCAKDLPYAWVNKWTQETTLLYAAGIYRNDTTFVDGQQMFYGLQLIVNNEVDTVINHSMCRGSFIHFNGQDIYDEGTYRDTLVSSCGCDSIVTLHLRVSDPYYKTEVVHIIEGGSTVFFGETYSEAGEYYHQSTTPDGCDSTTILQLIVHPKVDTVVTVCAKELPYAWVNKWTQETTLLYAAGVYRNDTTFVDGKQMFYGLQLIVNEATYATIDRAICQGSSIEIGGNTYSEPGSYTFTIPNSKGCDSIITLNLVAQPNYHDYIQKDIFEGDTVWFYGQPYTQPGRYPIQDTSICGCDSIVELVLGVHKLYNDSITICQNELPFPWVGPWRNDTIWIYREGIYRDTIIDPITNVKGIYSLKLTVRPIIHNDVPPTIHQICEGDFYIFNGQSLTEPGVYYDTLVAASNGCDSIIAIALQVMKSSSVTYNKTIYEGELVEFHGQMYGETGTYEYKEITQYGCDSIERLILNVLKEAHLDTTAYICDNELPYIWHGKEYWTSGKYQAAIESSTGKVLMTLDLHVRPTLYFERNLTFCESEGSYAIYRTDTIRESCSFFDTIPSTNGGCDSIIKVTIAFHPIEHHSLGLITISDDQSYNFFGRILRESGHYEYTTRSIHDCDSVIEMDLLVHPSYKFVDSIELCRHELPYTYTWNSLANYHTTTINKDKEYYIDSFATVWGFDSIYSLKVKIYDDTFEEQNYTLKAGSSTTIRGIFIDKPGVYMDTLLTAHGCDSVIKMVINPASTVYNEWSPVSMCKGETYEWFGENLTKSGDYYHKIESNQGDTIYHLNLTVNLPSLHEEKVTICAEDLPYIHNGEVFYHDTIISDTLKNSNGCDSILRYNLKITTHCSEWIQMPLCTGDTLFINGDTITEPGHYQYLKRSSKSSPLDSIYRIEVYKAQAFESQLMKVTICSNDTFYIGDKPILRAGLHDVTLKTVEGCDSVIHVDLTINPSYYIIDTMITTPDYRPVMWRGRTYSTTGFHEVYFNTIKNCDSIHALQLDVIPTIRDSSYKEICEEDSYVWHNRTLTERGYYNDTILNLASHTSVIYTLHLDVASPTYIQKAYVNDTCADADEFYIHFTYQGKRPEKYNVIFDEVAHDEGFKDILDKEFGPEMVAIIPIPSGKNVVPEGHNPYVRPGNYNMQLVIDNSACGYSRSEQLKVQMRYPSWIIEQNWGDVVAPLSAAYNGGYSFSNYEWYVNGSLVNSTGQGYLYYKALQPGDLVVMKATRVGESYAIPTCALEITEPKPNQNNNPILITPSSAPKRMASISIQSQDEGNYSIYSATGHLIQQGRFVEGTQTVTLPAVAGCYIIYAATEDGYSVNQKVLLY